MNKLVEKDNILGVYDFLQSIMIVDTDKHGRILLVEGFAGNDIEGQMYRWKHGLAISIHNEDTLESLRAEKWNEYYTGYQVVTLCQDNDRPCLHWDGFVIDKLANSFK